MEELEALAMSHKALPGFNCSDRLYFVQRAIEQRLSFYVQDNRYEVQRLIQTDMVTGKTPPLAALLFS